MANPNTPAGLVPIQRLGAADYRESLTPYYVAGGNSNALYVGDPVIKVAASADVNGINGVTLASAGTSNKITGVICGFLGAGAAVLGQPANPSFFALSGTPGPAYKPASATADYYVLVCDDPNIEYAIQSNDSGGAPAATVVGKNANLASGAGSPYTGYSGWQLAANQIGTSANNQLNIVGFLPEVDNVVGATHAKLVVRLNQSTETQAATGI